MTIGRERDGVDYDAWLFEQLLNDPKAGEGEMHHFFEEHPDFLAGAMMGVPISHEPYFVTNKQTPDFAVSPVLPRDSGDPVRLLELKGPEASVLASKRYLHRGLATAVTHARFYIDVKDANGTVTNWNLEMGSPLQLRRQGWARDSLKVGDQITVEGYPAKDGTKMASAKKVILADGRSVFGQSPSDANPSEYKQ